MRRLFIILLPVFLLASCMQVSDSTAPYEIPSHIYYIKDLRVNLCYAYFWGGAPTQGGPALAHVPCESVTDYLERPRPQKSQ